MKMTLQRILWIWLGVFTLFEGGAQTFNLLYDTTKINVNWGILVGTFVAFAGGAASIYRAFTNRYTEFALVTNTFYWAYLTYTFFVAYIGTDHVPTTAITGAFVVIFIWLLAYFTQYTPREG